MVAFIIDSEKSAPKEFSESRSFIVDLLFALGILALCLLSTSNDAHGREMDDSRALISQTDVSTTNSGMSDNKDISSLPVKNAPTKSSEDQTWEAFVPPPDNYDWIQLTSGEWLKGKLKVLYNKDIEFDSDELDLLKLDLEDVKRIRGYGIKGIRLEGPTKTVYGRIKRPEAITIYGTFELIKDKVIITSGEMTQEFDRSKLIAVVSGEDKEKDFWSAKISIGLNLTGGNTEQIDYSTNMDIRRRTAANRMVLNYLGNFTRNRGVDTVDNNRLNVYDDIFRTRQYYWRVLFGEYFRDPFQNIENRYTLGTGIGYHIIDTPKTAWDVTVGLAYQHTRFNSVVTGEDPEASTPALVVGTLYETELTKTIDFDVNYSFNLVNEESGQYTHHFVTSFETELTSWLDFDISFVWDRIEKPTANADGTIPEPDDYKLIFSLGVDY